MQVRKSTPPPTIERELDVDLTREEVISALVKYVKSSLGPNFKFDDIQVTGDDQNKLKSVVLSGVEIVALNWRQNLASDDVQEKSENIVPPKKSSTSRGGVSS